MTLVKWNPFREMNALHEDMNRLFSRLDPMRFDGGETGGRQLWTLAMDVIETENEIKLKAALPGIDPKDVNVQVEDNVLTVSAERRFEDKVEKDRYYWIEQQYGSFSRSVTLPQYADPGRIEAITTTVCSN
jgi:HSP20 family protein